MGDREGLCVCGQEEHGSHGCIVEVEGEGGLCADCEEGCDCDCPECEDTRGLRALDEALGMEPGTAQRSQLERGPSRMFGGGSPWLWDVELRK